jgi:hypothetical protein
MNHSFYSADRTIYSKIVAVALICATAVTGIGIAAHSSGGDGLAQAGHVGVIKIHKPMMRTPNIQLAVR